MKDFVLNPAQATALIPTRGPEMVEAISIEELSDGDGGAAMSGNCFGTLGSAGCPACFGTLGSFT